MINTKLFVLLSAVGVTLAAPTASTAFQAGAPGARQQVALKATAEKAEAKVMASEASQKAFANAKNDAEVKKLLLRNGFTASDLAGAKIQVNREGAKPAGAQGLRITVKIAYTCCPSTITITISW